MDKLKAEYGGGAKGAVYEALKPYLTGETTAGAYAEAAARLKVTEGAVKTALHRLRRRFGELLRVEIAQIVASPAEVDEEIRHLFAALGE